MVISGGLSTCELSADPRFDSQTVLSFTASQPKGQGIRFWLEVRVGGGEFAQISDANVRIVRDGNEGEFPFNASFDGRPQWSDAAAPGGTPYVLIWDHARDLGLGSEIGDAFVRLRYGSQRSTADEVQTAFLVGSADLGSPGRIGRAVPTIQSLQAVRADSDADFTITATLLDRAGGRAEIVGEYAFTEVAGQPRWQRWLDGTRSVDLPGGASTEIVLRLDPFAEGWPARVIDFAQFRVFVTESYPCRSPSELDASAPVATVLTNEAIGMPPRIDDIVLPTVVTGRTPVTVTVTNRSARRAAQFEIAGTYGLRVSGIAVPFVGPAHLVAPGTLAEPVIDLGPGERRTTTLLWTTGGDLGSGLSPVIGTVVAPTGQFQIPVSFATLTATAEVRADEVARTHPIRSDLAPTPASRVDTVPFQFPATYDPRGEEVSFRIDDMPEVASGAALNWSPNPLTREIQVMATTLTNCSGTYRPRGVAVPQHHLPVEEALRPYDRSCSTDAIASVLPTPFSTRPNALVRIGDVPLFVEWSPSQAPSVLDLDAAFGITFTTTTTDAEIMPPIPFAARSGTSVVLTASRSTPVPSGSEFGVTLTLQEIARDPGPNRWATGWQYHSHTVPAAAVPVGNGGAISPVFQVWILPYEFDGNPSTREFVVAAPGTAYRAPEYTSPLFAVWRLDVDGLVASATPLATLPQEPLDPGSEPLVAWQIASAPDDRGMSHLVLARQIGRPSQPNSRIEVFTLAPGASEWGRVNEPRVPDSNLILSRVVAADLNTDGQPDAVLSFKAAYVEPTTGFSRPVPGSRALVAFLTSRPVELPDWRYPVVIDPRGGEVDLATVADMDGDRNADLLLRWSTPGTTTRPFPHTEFRYAASTLVGSVRAVEVLPSPTRPDVLAAKLPALFDFDGNGTRDVITGEAVYIVRPGGERLRQPTPLGGGDFGSYRVEDLFPAQARATQIELLVRDRSAWTVLTLGGITSDTGSFRSLPITERIAVDGATGDTLIPLQPPAGFDSQGAKLLTGRDANGGIQHWRFDPTTRTYLPLVDARLPRAPTAVDRIVAVRTGDLTGRADLARNDLTQDLFALTTSQVIWFEALADGYAPARALDLQLGTGERIVAIGNGAFDRDPYEDLVVITITTDPGAVRVFAVVQQPGASERFSLAGRIGPLVSKLGTSLDEGYRPLRADLTRERLAPCAFFTRGASLLFGLLADGVTPYRIDLPISGDSAQDVVIGDIDGDDTPDLIVSEFTLSPRIFWVSRH